MQWLLESPLPALGIGVVAIALLVVAWQNTRRRELLTAMGGVLVFVVLLLAVEVMVVTESEAVEQSLEGLATALESNDVSEVFEYLSPEAEMRRTAENYLPSFRISDANVGNDLEITINRLTTPPTARAEFTGRLNFEKSAHRELPYNNFVRRFAIRLQKENGRWLMLDYDSSDFRNPPLE